MKEDAKHPSEKLRGWGHVASVYIHRELGRRWAAQISRSYCSKVWHFNVLLRLGIGLCNKYLRPHHGCSADPSITSRSDFNLNSILHRSITTLRFRLTCCREAEHLLCQVISSHHFPTTEHRISMTGKKTVLPPVPTSLLVLFMP